MRTLAIATLLAANLAGCVDSSCVGSACADYSYRTHRPGPCWSVSSADSITTTCSFTYNTSGNIEHVRCDTANADADFQDAVWTWADANSPASIDVTYRSSEERWVFDGQVTVTGREPWEPSFGPRVYDGASFAFLPLGGDGVATPMAELGLVSDRDVTFTWTEQAGQLVRTASTGNVSTFTIDSKRRITKIDNSPYTGNATFVYDGELLVSQDGVPFHYDAGNNLVEMSGTGWREVWGYGCW